MIRTMTTCAVATLAMSGAAPADELLERGSYLVNAVMACDSCHTPTGPSGFNMQMRFSGGSQLWDAPSYKVRGANISSDRDTGIGSWSAEDLKRLLTEGVRPNGIKVAPQMPFTFYKILTPRDLDAVVAYVRSIPAAPHEVMPPEYKTTMKYEVIPGAEKPMKEEDFKDSVKRGFYLGTIAHCMECHSHRPDGEWDFKNWYGRGGAVFSGPFGTVRAANITSHPTAGIGRMTDAQIKRVLTEGIGRDGRTLKPPMARQVFFSKMTDSDLKALIAWLRTVPPLE